MKDVDMRMPLMSRFHSIIDLSEDEFNQSETFSLEMESVLSPSSQGIWWVDRSPIRVSQEKIRRHWKNGKILKNVSKFRH